MLNVNVNGVEGVDSWVARVEAAEIAKVESSLELKNARAALNVQLLRKGSDLRSLDLVGVLRKRRSAISA